MYECRNDIDIFTDLARRLGIDGYNDKTELEWLRELTSDAVDDFDSFMRAGRRALPAARGCRRLRPRKSATRSSTNSPRHRARSRSTRWLWPPTRTRTVSAHIPPIPTWIAAGRRHHAYPLTPVHAQIARAHPFDPRQPAGLARVDPDDVWLHPDDAAARGIADGQPVRVFNRARRHGAAGRGHRPHRARRGIDQGRRLVHARCNRHRHPGLRQRAHARPRRAVRRDDLQYELGGNRKFPLSLAGGGQGRGHSGPRWQSGQADHAHMTPGPPGTSLRVDAATQLRHKAGPTDHGPVPPDRFQGVLRCRAAARSLAKAC